MIVLLILCSLWVSAPARALAQKSNSRLQIAEVLFEDYTGGQTSRWEMRSGEKVLLSFRVEGFGRLPVEGEDGLPSQYVKLQYRIELRDPQGVLVTPEERGEIVTTLSQRDEKWRPMIKWAAKVPPSAPSGNYVLRIRVTDFVAEDETAKEVRFPVQGESVPVTGSLQIINLEYAASESGPWVPLRYYARAETVWVRYKVAGYGVSPENEVWVEHDWTVLDETGKEIATETNGMVDKQQSMYPPRFLATMFNVKLRVPKPGKYSLRVDLRDRVGEQSASLDSTFFLRP